MHDENVPANTLLLFQKKVNFFISFFCFTPFKSLPFLTFLLDCSKLRGLFNAWIAPAITKKMFKPLGPTSETKRPFTRKKLLLEKTVERTKRIREEVRKRNEKGHLIRIKWQPNEEKELLRAWARVTRRGQRKPKWTKIHSLLSPELQAKRSSPDLQEKAKSWAKVSLLFFLKLIVIDWFYER